MIILLTAAALAGHSLPPGPGAAPARLEATAKPAAPAAPAEGTILPFTRLPDQRLTVEVAVGDKGPFRFLVDTAADRSAVSRQLATRLALQPSSDALLHSVVGVSRVRTATLRGLRIASRTVPDVSAPLLDGSHLGADGILGTDLLRSAVVRFDFTTRQLSIREAGRRSADADVPGTIVVRARRRAGRLIVTEADLDGQRLTIVLDTGSEVSVGNAALRRALARRGDLAPEQPAVLGSVTGETMPATFTTSRRLQVGDVILQGLGIAFADVHTFKALGIDGRPALLLGMDALQAFDSVTIDMPARKLRFVRPRAAFAASR